MPAMPMQRKYFEECRILIGQGGRGRVYILINQGSSFALSPQDTGLKGLFLLIKSHILDGNEVWYCSFWSERPLNSINLKTLVLVSVPRDRELPLRCHSRSLGTNFQTKIVKFKEFIDLFDQNKLYHTPLPNMRFDEKKKMWEYPFKCLLGQKVFWTCFLKPPLYVFILTPL